MWDGWGEVGGGAGGLLTIRPQARSLAHALSSSSLSSSPPPSSCCQCMPAATRCLSLFLSVSLVLVFYIQPTMAAVEPVLCIECDACKIIQYVPSDSPQQVRFCLNLYPRRLCDRCCSCTECIDRYKTAVHISVDMYCYGTDHKHRSLQRSSSVYSI